MLIRTAAIVLCVAVAPVAAQTFSRVEVHPGLGTMDHILAVATGVPQNFKLGRLETSVSDRMTLLQVVQKTGDPSRGP